MKKKENDEVKVNRRKFIKKAGIIGGAVAAAPLLNIASQEKVAVDKKVMMSKVLAAKEQMINERKLVENAIGNVMVNAFMGHRGGKGVDFVAAYKNLGGNNQESIAIFSTLNRKLAAKAIFTRGMNDKVLLQAINESITEFAAGNIGVVSAKNKLNRYDIVSSSFRVMVDLGGTAFKNVLDQKKVGIKGFNR